MKKRELLQTKSLESERLKQELSNLESMMSTIEQKKVELLTMIKSLDRVKDKKNPEILVPLGAGIFVDGVLKNQGKTLISIGSNVVIEKDVRGAKQIVKNQVTELDKTQEDIQREISRTNERLSFLEQELIVLYNELSEKK